MPVAATQRLDGAVAPRADVNGRPHQNPPVLGSEVAQSVPLSRCLACLPLAARALVPMTARKGNRKCGRSPTQTLRQYHVRDVVLDLLLRLLEVLCLLEPPLGRHVTRRSRVAAVTWRHQNVDLKCRKTGAKITPPRLSFETAGRQRKAWPLSKESSPGARSRTEASAFPTPRPSSLACRSAQAGDSKGGFASYT